MTKIARLRAPASQAPREDIVPKGSNGPKVALIEDPAELLYQSYAGALDHKGPRGVALRLWHELANKERKAWRFAFHEMRLLLASSERIIVPTPKPGSVLIVIAHKGAYGYHKVDRDELRTIAQVRKMLADLDAEVSEREGELHHG